jgi:pimeloyl-ACP methyl ester carboxylesterase
MLGHERVGTGSTTILVMNDWLCDTSTWDAARTYLDLQRFTWVFADLRGYGRSRAQRGDYTLLEAASDVLRLAAELGDAPLVLVGHSMSALVAYYVAQHHPERVARVIVLTPPPPGGLGLDDATVHQMQAGARAQRDTRLGDLRRAWAGRLSDHWVDFKEARWRATADDEAVAKYAEMFGPRGLPDVTTKIEVPLLAITGEQDAPVMRSAAVRTSLEPLCGQLTIVPIASSGHYPMQETPPLLVTLVERFAAAE